jgi:hypothetical protein
MSIDKVQEVNLYEKPQAESTKRKRQPEEQEPQRKKVEEEQPQESRRSDSKVDVEA